VVQRVAEAQVWVGGEKVARTCQDLIAEGTRSLILNLQNSSIVNSVGVSFLIEVVERVRDLEGRVAFCCVSHTIGKTFQIMGLLETASLHSTEREALKALGEGG
jgi:anti-anti-sigma factor